MLHDDIFRNIGGEDEHHDLDDQSVSNNIKIVK